MLSMWTSHIEVDLRAIAHNVQQIQKNTKAPLCAVVKSDAYGHGATITSLFLDTLGVPYLAVSEFMEALELTGYGLRTPILILTPPLPAQMPLVVKTRLVATVSSPETLLLLNAEGKKQGKKAPIHIKVDTGMGRIGVSVDRAVDLIAKALSCPYIKLEGIYTHFASAYNDLRFSRIQLDRLLAVRERLAPKKLGITWHAANSAALVTLPESHLDLVRIGTLLYGQSPVPLSTNWSLADTWRMYSKIIQVKKVPKNTSINYGRSYVTKREAIIGVIATGYGDGLGVIPSRESHLEHIRNSLATLIKQPRQVVIGGQGYPIVGKTAMGLSCIDLTTHPSPQELVGVEAQIECRRVNANRKLPKCYRHDKGTFALWNDTIFMLDSEGQSFQKFTIAEGVKQIRRLFESGRI